MAECGIGGVDENPSMCIGELRGFGIFKRVGAVSHDAVARAARIAGIA